MRTQRAFASSVLALVSVAVVGCAPGASYDDITGGARPAGPDAPAATTRVDETRTDATLAPPRPVGPLSASVLTTKRPTLRWSNGDGATGVTVELSRTRDFAAARTFTLDGESGTVPEDIEPGTWFWRLRSRAPGRVGTEAGPVWQMHLRGSGKRGSAPVPMGSILDVNGDGAPDLVVGGDATFEGVTSPAYFLFVSNGDDLLLDGISSFEGSPPGTPFSFGGGTDFDGDGFGDFAFATLFAMTEEGNAAATTARLGVGVELGAANEADRGHGRVVTRFDPVAVVTNVAAAGDVDGDGYGDLVYFEGRYGVLGRGGRGGPNTILPLYRAPGVAAIPLAGGFDANGDGFADVVLRDDAGDAKNRATIFMGSSSLDAMSPATLTPSASGPFELTSFASGDLDGDGIADLITTASKGTGEVCTFFGDRAGAMRRGPCVPGDSKDAAWGIAVAVVDVDGDGRDEVLVGARDARSTRVDALRVDTNDVLIETLVRGVGTTLVAMSPGWAGKPGRWAAGTPARDAVHVFDGRDERHVLVGTRETTSFGRAMR